MEICIKLVELAYILIEIAHIGVIFSHLKLCDPQNRNSIK